MTRLGAFISTALFIVGQRLGAKDKGAQMVEYGLLITLIAMVVLAALVLLGPEVRSLYTGATSAL